MSEPSADHLENVAAIRAAIHDMELGDRGRPAIEIIEELRRELESPNSADVESNFE